MKAPFRKLSTPFEGNSNAWEEVSPPSPEGKVSLPSVSAEGF